MWILERVKHVSGHDFEFVKVEHLRQAMIQIHKGMNANKTRIVCQDYGVKKWGQDRLVQLLIFLRRNSMMSHLVATGNKIQNLKIIDEQPHERPHPKLWEKI